MVLQSMQRETITIIKFRRAKTSFIRTSKLTMSLRRSLRRRCVICSRLTVRRRAARDCRRRISHLRMFRRRGRCIRALALSINRDYRTVNVYMATYRTKPTTDQKWRTSSQSTHTWAKAARPSSWKSDQTCWPAALRAQPIEDKGCSIGEQI